VGAIFSLPPLAYSFGVRIKDLTIEGLKHTGDILQRRISFCGKNPV
jgi:hypothetical protein